jgi:type I restriction enzyme S subunit
MKATERAIDFASETLEAARRLKTAYLHQLFSEGLPGCPESLKKLKWLVSPDRWPRKRLGELADVAAGFTMGRDLSAHERVAVPYVTVINVQDGFFDLNEISTVEIKRSELETGLLKTGDVLMTEGGDRDKLGRGAIWTDTVAPCAYQNHIFRVRFKSNEYCPKLFHYFIQSWQAKRYFFSHAKQTNNLCTINSRELKKLPVAIPLPSEQTSMVDLLDGNDAAVEAARERIVALVRLKHSLLQNLITGRVRVA